MNHKEDIKQRLENYPWFRERKAKNFGIAKMLKNKYNVNIDPKTLEDLIVEASSLDRVWRQILQHNPHLRGSDYGQGEILSQEKQIDLGYEVGSSIDKQIKLKL
jgi:hypothetical protein